jgi:hypothetical protein
MMDRDTRETLIRELEDLPEVSLQGVCDFVQFLKRKATQGHLETTLLSESALQKDWLTPEDEAWQNLISASRPWTVDSGLTTVDW